MVTGREMLNEMHDKRVEENDANMKSSLASEYYGKGFKVKASDLIMMNVPEKIDFLTKRKHYLAKKQENSGITSAVKETLKKRKMTIGDLKYLPACEVKDILYNP